MVFPPRLVEVFTASCPLGAEAANVVKSLGRPNCDVRIYDRQVGYDTIECREKVRRYGINEVPAIAVDGVVLDCCRRGPIDAAVLRAAGIGQP
jgi:hypothetical protein